MAKQKNLEAPTAVEQLNDPRANIVRANKLTTFWEGDGIAVGAFYKTHEKLMTVKSTDEAVIAAGYSMPVSTEEVAVTAQAKLASFKEFLSNNAVLFGILYDTIDRRADEYKFPNKYDAALFSEFGRKMAEKAITECLEKVQSNVIANMIKSEHLAVGTDVSVSIGEGEVAITESYPNGSIKYGTIKYPVTFYVGVATDLKQTSIDIIIELVSGQVKKPRELDGVVLTMTGMKDFFVEKELLPKIEKKAKEKEVVAEESETTTESGAEPVSTENPVE